MGKFTKINKKIYKVSTKNVDLQMYFGIYIFLCKKIYDKTNFDKICKEDMLRSPCKSNSNYKKDIKT